LIHFYKRIFKKKLINSYEKYTKSLKYFENTWKIWLIGKTSEDCF